MGALRQPDLAEGHSEEDDRGRLLLWAAVRPSVPASVNACEPMVKL